MMVALAELKNLPMSADRELEILSFVNNASPHLPGSFPGLLALFARQSGCDAALYEDEKKLEAIFRLSTDQTKFPGLDPAKALIEHRDYVRRAEEGGVPVTRGDLELPAVAELAKDARVLMLVSTAADVSGLHWVLLKNYDPTTDTCVLMEPALGQNFTGPLDFFLDHYTRTHPFLGVAITLKKN